MTSEPNEEWHGAIGRVDDETEAREASSTHDGPAAAGEYDPRQGSPGHPHPPTPPGFSEEITHYDTSKGADA